MPERRRCTGNEYFPIFRAKGQVVISLCVKFFNVKKEFLTFFVFIKQI